MHVKGLTPPPGGAAAAAAMAVTTASDGTVELTSCASGAAACGAKPGGSDGSDDTSTCGIVPPPLRPATTTLPPEVQQPPVDPRVSRAGLPADYDRRSMVLLARMAAAATVYGGAVAAAAVALVVLVGWRQLLVLAVAAEAAFLVYYRRLYSALNAQPPAGHLPDRHDGLVAFNRLLQAARSSATAIDPQSYLSGWFCDADHAVVRADNLVDLLAYACWYTSTEEMEAAGQGPLLRSCAAQLQAAFGISLPPGRTSGLRCMYHLWEPLRATYRPLLFYGATEVLAALTWLLLAALGCSLHSDVGDVPGGMLVATAGMAGTAAGTRAAAGRAGVGRRGTAGRSSRHVSADGKVGQAAGEAPAVVAPVLLLHGVGLGLLSYINFIRCLVAAGLPVVALEFRHVSLRLCSGVPAPDDIAAGVVALMDRMELPQACVVAHSYGTFVASRLVQLHPARLQSLALLDPVCCGMFLPSLVANFLYRPPRTTDLATWIEDAVRSFLSRDLHCAAAMCRRFYWSDLNLWPQDMPGRTLVALGGRDRLIDSDAILGFIRHYAAKIMYHPNHSHAQYLADPHWQQQIVADIYSMAWAGCGEVGAAEVERRLTAASCADGSGCSGGGGGGSCSGHCDVGAHGDGGSGGLVEATATQGADVAAAAAERPRVAETD